MNKPFVIILIINSAMVLNILTNSTRCKRLLLPASPNNMMSSKSCKKYSENLTKLWDFLNLHNKPVMPRPETRELYNIAVILQDYLNKTGLLDQKNTRRSLRKMDLLENTLEGVKKIIVTSEPSNKMFNLVIKRIKQMANDPDDEICRRNSQSKLIKYTRRALTKYRKAIVCPTVRGRNLNLRAKRKCKDSALNNLMKLLRGIALRYVVSMKCLPDETF